MEANNNDIALVLGSIAEILESALKELRSQKPGVELGFGPPPGARRIYANRQYPDCLWYFWNKGENRHEPIAHTAITGVIEKLEIEEKEFRGATDRKINLYVRADRPYVIQSGIDTLFGKCLLHTLSKMPTEAFKGPVTVAVEAGDTEQVLFCRIYNPATGNLVFAPYTENTDWAKVEAKAIEKIAAAHQ